MDSERNYYHQSSSQDFERERKVEKPKLWGKRLLSLLAIVVLIGLTVAVAAVVHKANENKGNKSNGQQAESTPTVNADVQVTKRNATCTQVSPPKRTVMFWQSEVDGCEKVPDGVTHVVFGFALVDESGQVVPTFQTNDTAMKACVATLKKRCISTMASIGGSTNVEQLAAATDNLLFVASAVALLEKFGFDGLDIDDEAVGDQFHADKVVARIKSTRDALNAKHPGALLTYDAYFREGEPLFCHNASVVSYSRCFPTALLPYVDWINIMAYNVDKDPLQAAAFYETALNTTFAAWGTQLNNSFEHATIGICVGPSCAYGPGPSSAVIESWNTFARQPKHGGMMLYAGSTDITSNFAVTKSILPQ